MSASALEFAAEGFLAQCRHELGWDSLRHRARRDEVRSEIAATGAWTPTSAELEHGARLAWRHSARCIGRLFWNTLEVRDARDVRTAGAVADRLREHLLRATNGGRIRPLATVFAPRAPDGTVPVRIWNHQLLGYAGYRRDDGSFLGDPKNAEFTALVQSMGWEGEGTAFDLLPWVIETSTEGPRLFSPPRAEALEVPITHPRYGGFVELGLRWYAVPVLADLAFHLGGLEFPAAPFNGWYMGTEIGARNFADPHRYDLLPRVADLLGLDRSRDRSLWKDRALVELNAAVLASFERAGVRMVDHHQASVEFMEFARREEAAGRAVSADWSWIVPPMSGAATPVFHRVWREAALEPSFRARPSAWSSAPAGGKGCPFHGAGAPVCPVA